MVAQCHDLGRPECQEAEADRPICQPACQVGIEFEFTTWNGAGGEHEDDGGEAEAMKGDIDQTMEHSEQEADAGDRAEAAVLDMVAALLVGV